MQRIESGPASRFRWGCAIVFLALGNSLSNAAASDAPRAAGREELTDLASASWARMRNARLTPDGRWFTYELIERAGAEAQAAPITLVFKSTRNQTERRFPAGEQSYGAGGLKTFASGRWVSFKTAPDFEAGRKLKDAGQEIRTSVAMVELSTGRRIDIPDVERIAFVGEESEWVGLIRYGRQSPAAAAALSAEEREDPSIARRVATLRDLCRQTPEMAYCSRFRSDGARSDELTLWRAGVGAGAGETLSGVATFAFEAAGKRVAWADEQGLHWRELASKVDRALKIVPGGACSHLSWSPRGKALAAICSSTTDGANTLQVFRQVGPKSERHQSFSPGQWPGFPDGFNLSATGVTYVAEAVPYMREPIVWRDDEEGLFVGVSPRSRSEAPADPGASSAGPVLWHWQDTQLPAARKLEAALGGKRPFSYLGFVSLTDGTFVQLANADAPHALVQGKGPYLLAFDSSAYDLTHDVTGKIWRDYYVVELRTGKRQLLAKQLLLTDGQFLGLHPTMSPDGTRVLYQDLQDGGGYVVYDARSETRRIVTAGLPTAFYDETNLKEEAYPFAGERWPILQGWSADGEYALVSDYRDVWALPLAGATPLNLTGNGRRDNIIYVRTVFGEQDEFNSDFPFDERTQYADVSKPLHFRTFNRSSGQTGLARRLPGGRMQTLRQEDAEIRVIKAARGQVYAYRRQTAVEFPDYRLLDAEWAPVARLTDANPQQQKFRWSPGARLLSYQSPDGRPLQAILHLPADYVEGRAYPTIVVVYEVQSLFLHKYQPPNPYGFPSLGDDIPRWTQRGYAVLLPDIPPRMRGMDVEATEDVTAAVHAAVATGVVDEKRLGLTGQSFGGYETNLLVTQTSLFKAAVAVSGASDLFSDFGGVYGNRTPKTREFMTRQPYIGGPWWQYWDAYVKGSPIFQVQKIQTPLLLVHGDADKVITFSQPVELFNTLRLLGNKQVVLLQYRDEGHVINRPENTRDMTMRIAQFFDHFLMDRPAPPWWAQGTSRSYP